MSMKNWTYEDVVISTRKMHRFDAILSMVRSEREDHRCTGTLVPYERPTETARLRVWWHHKYNTEQRTWAVY